MDVGNLGSLAGIAVLIGLAATVVTEVAKKYFSLEPTTIHLTICGILGLLCAIALPRVFHELPTDLTSWLGAALSGSGLGQAAHRSWVREEGP